jgi:hypothetical protein
MRKVVGELHIFLQGSKEAFENKLSIKREIVLSVQRIQGLAKVPKKEKSPIVKEETSGRRSRSLREGALKGLQGEKKGSSRSHEARSQSRPLDIEGHMKKD